MDEIFDTISLRVLVPIILIQFILMVVALIDLFNNNLEKKEKWIWFFVILLVNIFGPIAYFILKRRDI